jgi:hypothetical protein
VLFRQPQDALDIVPVVVVRTILDDRPIRPPRIDGQMPEGIGTLEAMLGQHHRLNNGEPLVAPIRKIAAHFGFV